MPTKKVIDLAAARAERAAERAPERAAAVVKRALAALDALDAVCAVHDALPLDAPAEAYAEATAACDAARTFAALVRADSPAAYDLCARARTAAWDEEIRQRYDAATPAAYAAADTYAATAAALRAAALDAALDAERDGG